MGESSACLIRSFSQPSPTSQDPQEEDPLRHVLTASVSFGRFMSESLAWEKWSSFTQNRYLEEIEKYAKPGSVAEKKAYFEAHYKRKAAQKAAASLEQQNAVVNDIPGSSLTTDSNSQIETAQGREGLSVAIKDGLVEKDPTSDLNSSIDECGWNPFDGYKVENHGIEEIEQGKQPTFVENLVEYSVIPKHGQIPLKGCRIESGQNEATELGIEQPTSVENHIQPFIITEYGQSPLLDCGIEGDQIYMTQQEIGHPTFVQKEVELSTLLEYNQEAKETAAVEVSASSDKKKPASSSANSSGAKRESGLWSPLKPTTTVQQPKNVDQLTSYSKKTVRQSVEKKISTPKSIHMSINFGSLVGSTNKSSFPEFQKKSSRLLRNLSRTTRESIKQETPTMASTCGLSKHQSVTSQPAIRRSSISSTTCRRKAEYPTVSASFNLRTEERARKRKEKLQQKLDMEVAGKEQLQGSIRKDAKDVQWSFIPQGKSNASSHPGMKHLGLQAEKGSIRKDARDVQQSMQSITSRGKANTSSHPGTKHLDLQAEKIRKAQPYSPGVPGKQKYVVAANTRLICSHSIKDPRGKNRRPPTYTTKLFPQRSTNENASPNVLG